MTEHPGERLQHVVDDLVRQLLLTDDPPVLPLGELTAIIEEGMRLTGGARQACGRAAADELVTRIDLRLRGLEDDGVAARVREVRAQIDEAFPRVN